MRLTMFSQPGVTKHHFNKLFPVLSFGNHFYIINYVI